MPLCELFHSECLGTLPGAWAKQCGNVLEVNAWEWLWGTAWAASAGPCSGSEADTVSRSSCHRENSVLRAPSHLSLTHTFFFILRFLLIVAECPLSPPAKKKKKTNKNEKQHQQVHTGGTQQAPLVSLTRGDVLLTCQLGLGDENMA